MTDENQENEIHVADYRNVSKKQIELLTYNYTSQQEQSINFKNEDNNGSSQKEEIING